MNERIERETLEDVLNDYVDSTPVPNHATLAEWVKRYPQYANDLTEFTVSWMRMETLPAAPDWAEADAERLVQAGRDAQHRGIQATNIEQPDVVEPPILNGIIAAAGGLSLSQIAARVGLGEGVVRQLDRRLIKSDSVPAKAIEAIATAIQVPQIAVVRYLEGGAKLATGAQYRSEQAPRLAEPENFFDAVRNDRRMSQELKERWLALEPDGGKQ